MKCDTEHRPHRIPEEEEGIIRRVGTEVGLSTDEAAYLKLISNGSAEASTEGELAERRTRRGMVILSGDGKRILPVHSPLGLANHFRTWRESMMRKINERRMRIDRLMLEPIPVYGAATEKRADEGGKQEILSDCSHDIVFIGMVNVNRDNYLQGVVDVWRCRKCKRVYCDDRRYGETLKASVGFEPIPDDEKWGILTCTTVKEVAMNSLGVKPGKKVTHVCKSGETHEFVIGEDYSLSPKVADPIHRIYLVEEYVNKNVEAGYYKLTLR